MRSANDDPFDVAVGQARRGEMDAAAATLEQLLRARPDHARAWAMRGSLRLQAGRPQEALDCYERSLELRPDDAATQLNRGNALSGLNRTAEALASFERAIALSPGLAAAHGNRAQALNVLDRFGEALESADRALALDPRSVNAWRHRGQALGGLERPEESLECYRSALAVGAPGQRSETLSEMGQAFERLGRADAAIAAYDEALALEPAAALARFRRGRARLTQRCFAAGWDDYEARWLCPSFTDASAGQVTPALRARLTLAPRPQDLAGRRVLVLAEQGVGDEIMFGGVLPDLIARAAAVTCVVEPRLAGLFTRSLPAATILAGPVDAGLDLAGFDRVVALGSLAGAFRRSADAFPRTPYLAPAPAVTEAWRARLGPRTTRLRIGLSWRGGASRTGGPARSMTLETLRPLLERADCEVVSLQYGDTAAELATINATLARPMRNFPAHEIDDFEQLAGLVVALDAVVTVQTALAHVTGATGQRGMVMIPERAQWRYADTGETMPWYGSLRILRQGEGEGWTPVIARVGEALDAMAPHP